MPHIDTIGNRLHYTISRADSQSGSSLVCVHGSGGSHTHWPDKLRTQTEICVTAIDMPGHGKSQGKGHDTVKGYAAVLDAFIKAMNFSRVILMGHSLGGAIAQTLALEAPTWLEKIILVGTGARLRVAPSIFEALLVGAGSAADLISALAFGPSARRNLVDVVRRELQQTPVMVTRNDFRACDGFDAMQTIENIRIPTLVISGSEDQLTPPKYGAYLAANIPGARHVIIPNAGHMMALEYPDIFTKHVITFIDPTTIQSEE